MSDVGAWTGSLTRRLKVPVLAVEWNDYGFGCSSDREGRGVWFRWNDLGLLYGWWPQDDADIVRAGDVGFVRFVGNECRPQPERSGFIMRSDLPMTQG
jgi:hypothetical protein